MYNAYPAAGVMGGSTGVTDYYDRLQGDGQFPGTGALQHPWRNARRPGRAPACRRDGLDAVVAAGSSRPIPSADASFTEEEGEIGKTNKAILTYASWQQWFGGQDSAVGRDVRINGEPFAIVGVLPQSFRFLDPEVKLWIPVAFSAEEKSDDNRHSNNWSYVARLKPGATVEQARQQIDALNARNLDRFPNLKQILINAGFHTVVVPLQDYLVRDIRSTLYLLWGGVVFVLLVGGVNVTNLMLVRSSARMKELATRHALGAGLGRIAGQLLTETVLLALGGGARWASGSATPACARSPLQPRLHAAGHRRSRWTRR